MDADQELLAVFRDEVDEKIDLLCERLSRAPSRWRIDRLFQISHNVKGAARTVDADSVRDAAHILEDLFSAVRDGLELTPEVVELARSGAGMLEACFRSLGDAPDSSVDAPELEKYRQQVQRCVTGGNAAGDGPGADTGTANEQLETSTGKRPGSTTGAANNTPEPATLRDEPASAGHRQRGAETVRVGAGKLDTLLGLTTELTTQLFQLEGSTTLAKQASSQIEQATQTHPQLRSDILFRETRLLLMELARRLDEQTASTLRVTEELQGSVRALRMVRFDGLRSLLNRTLRDANTSTGRSASLRLTGGDTEVDRMVLEELRDPLVHLLRNAVAHGIEPVDERATCGKETAGIVELSARSAGRWVEVVVSDDGRGIDPATVRERALASDTITSQEARELSDEQVIDLLFLPGLSTAEKVTELAGRGVGLDVVRSHVARIGGTVTIASTLKEGTRVTLRLPLTRLTTSGVLIRLGEQLFAVPACDVERTVLVPQAEVATAEGDRVVEIGGLWTRLASLAGVLGYQGALARIPHQLSTAAADLPQSAAFARIGLLDGLSSTTAQPSGRKHHISQQLAGLATKPGEVCGLGEERPALVVHDGPLRRAILVDEVLGQREYLAQQLPWNLRDAPALSGCAVLEGSQVVLVLDSRALIGSRRDSGAWTSPHEIRQRRLLVVDDSATSRTLEYNILKAAGYDVVTAINGELALQVLREHDIDLVISDVEMPIMNGLELVRQLRREPELEHLPVVLVTSMGSEEDRQNGAEAGADAYIVKGAFDQDELLQTIARLL
jgi:two-component system chemotaxis sensor kinase CheA